MLGLVVNFFLLVLISIGKRHPWKYPLVTHNVPPPRPFWIVVAADLSGVPVCLRTLTLMFRIARRLTSSLFPFVVAPHIVVPLLFSRFLRRGITYLSSPADSVRHLLFSGRCCSFFSRSRLTAIGPTCRLFLRIPVQEDYSPAKTRRDEIVCVPQPVPPHTRYLTPKVSAARHFRSFP